MTYLYLLLNVFTISFPLVRSFEGRLQLWKKWYALLPAIAVTGAVYISWDVAFTDMGIWGFREQYLTGLDLLNLPVEEWLFFLTVPYACVFIYECVIYFQKEDRFRKYGFGIALVLAAIALLMGLLNMDRWYTSTTFFTLSGLLLLNVFIFRSAWLGRFFFAYLFCVIPFFIVNGVLTGSWIEGEVVWYNDAENLDFRLGTIPVEDIFYGMGLILMNVTIYELILKRWPKQKGLL